MMRFSPAHVRSLVLAFVAASSPASGQIPSLTVAPGDSVQRSARHAFRVVTVAEGLEYPSAMAWLPSGELLVTERPGRLRIVRNGVLDSTAIAGVPAVFRQRGQGGLLDIALHPDFARNRLVYLSHGKGRDSDSSGTLAVTRARLEGDRLVEVREVFVAEMWERRNNHFGGRMAFDAARRLYVTVGDRIFDPTLQEAHPSQALDNHFGTIVRIHDDGRVPKDNPFVAKAGALPSIWSYGHRNAQGVVIDATTGDVWETEHGPRGGDELNLILPGRNYGWPVVSWGVNYNGSPFTSESRRDGMESPRYAWVPSIATSGMTFYRGDAFPWWTGNLFVAALEGKQLVRLTLEDRRVASAEPLLVGAVGRIRDVREGPDGFLYLALEANASPTARSRIVRLEPIASDVKGPLR